MLYIRILNMKHMHVMCMEQAIYTLNLPMLSVKFKLRSGASLKKNYKCSIQMNYTSQRAAAKWPLIL